MQEMNNTPRTTDFCVKLNNRHLTLKLLYMIKILSILDRNTKSICVRDAIDTLDIPHVITLEISHEHEYQIDLYFHIVIEPNIAYTYPNQYKLLFMFVKYIIHRLISFIVPYVYLILLMYVMLSTCLLLKCTLSKNIYSTKVIICKSK